MMTAVNIFKTWNSIEIDFIFKKKKKHKNGLIFEKQLSGRF